MTTQKYDYFKGKLGATLAAWVGAFLLGGLLLAIGGLLQWGLLIRLGLICIAVAMLAQVVLRAIVYRFAGKIRTYSWVFLGLRVLAAVILLYAAARPY